MTLQEIYNTQTPVVLVTGSGSARVGRAVARMFASQGCNIALHANRSLKEAELAADTMRKEFNVQVMVTTGSLEDESVPEKIVGEAHVYFGHLDILINSAAIWSPTSLDDLSLIHI